MTCSNCGSMTSGAFCTNCGTAQSPQAFDSQSAKKGNSRLGLSLGAAFAALSIVGTLTIYGILYAELEESVSAESSLQGEIVNQQKKIAAAEKAYSDAQGDYLARLICDINYYWWTCDALYGTESSLLEESTSAKTAVDSGKAALDALRASLSRETANQKEIEENLSLTLYAGGGASFTATLTALAVFVRYKKRQKTSA